MKKSEKHFEKGDTSMSASLLLIVLSAVPMADASSGASQFATGVLVHVVLPEGSSIIGELGRENDTHIEVFGIETGEGTIYVKSDLRKVNKNVSDSFVIQTKGLAKLLYWKISKAVPKRAPRGAVAQVDGSLIYVTLGRQNGVGVGDTLSVFRGEKILKDPITGRELGEERRRISELEITEVREDYSKAKQTGSFEIALEVGDHVEPLRFANSIAVCPPIDATGHNTKAGVKIAEELTISLEKSGMPIVPHASIMDALAELGIQQTALLDPANAAQAGKLAGAYVVLAGTLFAEGPSARADFRLVEVETGKVLDTVTCSIRDLPDVDKTVATPVGSGTDRTTVPTKTSTTTSSESLPSALQEEQLYSPEFPGHSGGYVAAVGQEGIGINAVFWDEFSRHKGEQ